LTNRLFHTAQYKAVKDGIDTLSRNRSQYAHVFSAAQHPNSDLGRLIVGVSRSHIIIHKHRVRALPNEWSACRRGGYIHNVQQTPETNIHPLNFDSSPQSHKSRGFRPKPYTARTQRSAIHYITEIIRRQCTRVLTSP